jgi:hypothetical protein
MSNSVISKNTNSKMPQNVAVTGKEGVSINAPIGIQALTNRQTKDSVIKKYLKNGWNWNKFCPIIVAEFPESYRNDPDFSEYHNNELPLLKLLDGDHRKHMYKWAFPDDTQISAHKISVVSKEEYHRLFYQINWASRKNANKEEVFVHQVLAKESQALETERELKRCGVSIFGSPDIGGIVGALNSPYVNHGGFKRCVALGEANVKKAVETIKSCWGEDENLKAELMEGLTILYKLYPILSKPNNNKIKQDFDKFISAYAIMYEQSDAAGQFKDKGGRVHHKHGASITKGIVEFWRDSKKGICTPRHRKDKIQLSVINNYIEG